MLVPAYAIAQPTPSPSPTLQACTGTVGSIEAAQTPEPVGALWLQNLSCTLPVAKITEMGFLLVETGSGHVWQAGLTIAAAAYKRATVVERIVTVEFVPVANGMPAVLRINAPCIAVGSQCVGESATQN